EDGIRDGHVTGVQTCALPISWRNEPNGTVRITAYQLRQLIAIAYDSSAIQTRDQIVGGPGWLDADTFDIVAKANGGLNADETGQIGRASCRERVEEAVGRR